METQRPTSEIDRDYSDLFGMQLKQLQNQFGDYCHPNAGSNELMLHGPDLPFDSKTSRTAIINYPTDDRPPKAMIRFGTKTSCLQFNFSVDDGGKYEYIAKWQKFNMATDEWEEDPYAPSEDYATIMSKAVQWFAALEPYYIFKSPEGAVVESKRQGLLGRFIGRTVRS